MIFQHLKDFTTHGPDGSHFVLRDGTMPGLPFRLQVGHRRDGTHLAVHAIPIRLTADTHENQLVQLIDALGLRNASLFDILMNAREAGIPLNGNAFQVVLQQVIRPGAPQGKEWNGFGGVVGRGETIEYAMSRELEEEATGMKILAVWEAVPYFQAATGFYTEITTVYIALATGIPKVAADEGALTYKTIPLDLATHWIRDRNRLMHMDNSGFCPVDGKILLGLHEFNRMLRRYEIIGPGECD